MKNYRIEYNGLVYRLTVNVWYGVRVFYFDTEEQAEKRAEMFIGEKRERYREFRIV